MTLFAYKYWHALTLRERICEMFTIIGTAHAVDRFVPGSQCHEALERLAARGRRS